MRYLVDIAVFAGVFLVARAIFHNDVYALLAGVIVATLAEVVQGGAAKR
jgi:hypothetical protein